MISHGSRASDRATALVLSYYDAYNRRDWDAAVQFVAEDVAHDVNQGWREVGRARLREFLARTGRCFHERIGDLCVLALAEGTRAAAEFVIEGTYVESEPGLPPARGQKYTLRGGAFFEVNEQSRIARVTNYYNLQDWLRQIAD